MSAKELSIPNAPPEQQPDLQKKVLAAFQSVSGIIKAAAEPLPTQTGDGSSIQTAKSTGVFQDILHLHPKDVFTLAELAKDAATGKPIDDKKFLMERLIQVASELPLTSKNGNLINDKFIQKLYDDLEHPPAKFLNDEYRYRTADGSSNNIMAPSIGAANTSYARSVRPETLRPVDLPDPGDLFDNLMVRDSFTPHPAGLSSILFYLASVIIHDLFMTDRTDSSKNQTSSYLDLSPLYGNNQEEQNLIRTFQDGKIKADCFSNTRVLGFPPGVGVLLIMFNRFHNYVVQKLAAINEKGRFTKPKDDANRAAWVKYDNDLFQTGRLVTCGLYINCILKDYVRTILELNRTESDWDLDPRSVKLTGPTANGSTGNQVSAEFNLVYRWHAVLSKKDDAWVQDMYKRLFPGKEPNQISFHELLQGLDAWEKDFSEDPQQRPFADLKRSQDGSLNDDELVGILTAGIEDQAGAFGAKQVPEILRAVEILGIKQARSWNLATLNEFRSFFGLEKHETFESINSDPKVADTLKHLYDHPDFVELYPGLAIEEAKPSMAPGSALVRGDRFFMVDYTPNNLTNWGISEVASDVKTDQGHVFSKLFLRAFPNHFQPNSVYAHFPLVIPQENRDILTDLEQVDKYSWDKPGYIPPPTFVTSYAACRSILENSDEYKVTWGKAIEFLMHNSGKEYGADFMLSGDSPTNAASRELMCPALYKSTWEAEVTSFYEDITLQLLREHSYKISGTNQVDIVRDVGNLAQAHFSAEVFSLPLKTKENPHGIYNESQLYSLMALVFTVIFYDADPANSFRLRQASRVLVQQLGDLMEILVAGVHVAGDGPLNSFIEFFHKPQSQISFYGKHMIEQLLKSGVGLKDIIWSNILPTAGGMVANQGQLFAQCLDFYLSDNAASHLKEVHRLAKLDTPEADELLLRYFMEGARIRSTVGLYRLATKDATIKDGDKILEIKAGEELLCDLVTASLDPVAFPDPMEVKLDRPMDSYMHFGWGNHTCLGLGMTKLALTTMLKTVGKLPNLRRAPGDQGQIKKVAGPGGITFYMTADHSSFFPFPTTMKVRWDGDLPAAAMQK
ncbi:hypothetical protein ACLMJK_005247 [Lecanora helva]